MLRLLTFKQKIKCQKTIAVYIHQQKSVHINQEMGKIIENYSLQNELGSGVYSRVYRAVHVKTKQEVAIKMVKADKFKQLPKLQQGTINEINILSNLDPCPYIIKYYDMLKTVNNFYFVYEFCNGGTLQQILKKTGALSQSQALIYFRQIVEAFKVLNKHNIMHRDLKPQNILLNDGVIKIADFGFCKVLESADEMAQTMLGSPIYMAPEILKGENYTIKADVWSLGVILFRLVYGYCPFQSTNIAKLIILLQNEQLYIPSEPKVHPLVVNLIRRMLVKDARKRADWSQVFSYDILENGTFKNEKPLKDSGLGTTASSSITNSNLLGTETYNRSHISSSAKEYKQPKGKPELNLQGKGSFIQRDRHVQRSSENKSNFGSQMSQNENRGKSPFREKTNKLEIMIKNHAKCLQINALSIEVAAYSSFSAMCISFILSKKVEHELKHIVDTAKSQSTEHQQTQLFPIVKIVYQQISQLKKLSQIYKDEIYGYRQIDINSLEVNKKYYVREFVKTLQLECRQELVMASRLIDYVEQSLLIRKETYEKLSKEQLQRQIINNSKVKQ